MHTNHKKSSGSDVETSGIFFFLVKIYILVSDCTDTKTNREASEALGIPRQMDQQSEVKKLI